MKNKKLSILFALLVNVITSIQAQTEIVMTTTASSVSMNISWIGTGQVFANGAPLSNIMPIEIIPIDGKITLTTTDYTFITKLHCSRMKLTSLNLIICPHLEDLRCDVNKISVLDLSSCTKLKYLNCSGNLLTNLNITECNNLETINCSWNQLTDLNITECNNLEAINCSWNQLTDLDLSGSKLDASESNIYPKLKTLFCERNQLTNLNVTKCKNLENLSCGYNKLTSLELNALLRLSAGGQYIIVMPEDNTLKWLNPIQYTKALKINDKSYSKGNTLPSDIGAMLTFTTEQPISGATYEPIQGEPLGGTIMLINHPKMQPVTGITLPPTIQLEHINGNYTTEFTALNLHPVITPADATNKDFIWSNSGDIDVAHLFIYPSGDISLLTYGEGSTTITATTIDGGKIATCNVTVVDLSVKNIAFAPETLQLHIGKSTSLTPIITPTNAVSKTLYWSSSNNNVVSVSHGTITAHNKGTATIRADIYKNGHVSSDNNNRISGYCNVTVVNPPTETIAVNPTMLELEVGSSARLNTTITPANAGKTIVWASENSDIATVSDNGTVTAHAEGTTAISVTTVDGNKTAYCSVRVQPKTIAVTGINITPMIMQLWTGDNAILTPIITPDNATNKSVIWRSSNTTVATVSTNGIVTAHAEGTTAISATTIDGNRTNYSYINVLPRIVVTNISLSPTTLKLQTGDNVRFTPIITPYNATNKSIIWASSNISVATVSTEGLVTTHTEGFTTISATTVDGNKTASCSITVSNSQPEAITITGIDITPVEIQLKTGYSRTITATITPNNATNQSIIWHSNNIAVATVSTNGTVTAHSEGTTTISATTVDGNITALCSVYVTKPQSETIAITGISIDPATLKLQPGQSLALVVKITPANATNQDILWESDNTNVATVSANGIVTAHSLGSAIVSATSAENGIIKSTCNLTVTQYVSNETINTESIIAYPNPTNGKVTISGLTHGETFHIYNQIGLLVTTFVASDEKMTIDLSHLSSGIYFLKTNIETINIIIL